MGTSTIQQVLFHQPLRSGTLVLALMSDKTLRILHNGEQIGEQYWSESQADDAAKAFRLLQQKFARQPQQQR